VLPCDFKEETLAIARSNYYGWPCGFLVPRPLFSSKGAILYLATYVSQEKKIVHNSLQEDKAYQLTAHENKLSTKLS